MATLPVPGESRGTWGEELNDYLSVAHDADGYVTRAGLAADVRASVANIRGNLAIATGDSITSGGTNASLGRLNGYTSWFSYAVMYSGQRLRQLANVAVGGETSSQIAARFQPDVLDRHSAVAMIMCGTNDADLAVTKANITTMVEQSFAAGVLPVLLTIPPQDAADTNKRNTFILPLNYWLLNYASRSGIVAVDTYAAMVDPMTGDYQAAYTDDGVHPTEAAARAMGRVVADTVAPLLPDTPLPLQCSAQGYANLIANGTFTGDSDSDGLADGWSNRGGSSSAPSYALESGTDGVLGNWQGLTVTGIGSRQIGNTAVTAGFVPGDTLALACRVRSQNSEATGSRIRIGCWFDGASQAVWPVYNPIVDLDDGAIYGEFTVPDGATSVVMTIELGGATAGEAVTVNVAQASLINLTALGLA